MFLGIDTSGPIAFVAVGDESSFIELARVNDGSSDSRGSENIYDLTREALEKRGVSWREIRGIFLGDGPGSFTGLRIGFSFAQGIASALKIPCAQVSSFAGWSMEAHDSRSYVAVVADAQREDLFCQVFAPSGLSIAGPSIISRDQVAAHVADVTNTHINQSEKEEGSTIKWVGFADLSDQNISVHKPEHGASGVILEGQKKGLGVFSPLKIAELSPNYIREVSARTLADRGKKIVP